MSKLPFAFFRCILLYIYQPRIILRVGYGHLACENALELGLHKASRPSLVYVFTVGGTISTCVVARITCKYIQYRVTSKEKDIEEARPTIIKEK